MKAILSRFICLSLSVLLISFCHYQVIASETYPYSYSDELGITYTVYTDHASVSSYQGSQEDIAIPSNICGVPVTSIGKRAFENAAISSVVIPDTVTEIQNYAFYECQLSSIQLPDTINTIGLSAFAFSELSSISLPDSVDTIKSFTFLNCTSLKQIELPSKLQMIGQCAFSCCAELSSGIILPDSLVSIGDNAFEHCVALEDISLSNNLESIGTEAFMGCKRITDIEIPSSVQSIGEHAFYGCESLSKITLPTGLRQIGTEAFLETKAWENVISDKDWENTPIWVEDGLVIYCGVQDNKHVQFPEGTVSVISDVVSLPNALELTMPNSLRILRTESLTCQNLIILNLNEGLETIESKAVHSNYLQSIYIPQSVVSIAQDAFQPLTLQTIYGTPGTAAEEFALENGIAFHDAAELQLSGEPVTINYGTDTWSIQNAGRAFNNERYLTNSARIELLSAMATSQDTIDTAWDGACFGLSISLILLKIGVFTPEQIQPGAKTVSEITSDKAVQSFLNYYHFTQFSEEMLSLATSATTESQSMYRIIQMGKAANHGGLPFLISFSFTESGHAVVGYGQEDGSWEIDGETFDSRILIWDPNFPTAPNENAYLYYDSRTLAHCIPYYNADSVSAGFIKRVTNAVDVLNAHPYPFDTRSGDVNRDGEVRISDAVMLAHILAEDAGAETTAAGLYSADCNNDGLIQLVDLRVLLKQLTD